MISTNLESEIHLVNFELEKNYWRKFKSYWNSRIFQYIQSKFYSWNF